MAVRLDHFQQQYRRTLTNSDDIYHSAHKFETMSANGFQLYHTPESVTKIAIMLLTY